MTQSNTSNQKGLNVGDTAPSFETVDIDKNEVSLTNLLKSHKGVLIDFFRGNW